ncbi:MAG: hypothetical protein Q7K21_04620, partial [Elusimicrobiota bacterium]|nr:hypothetical protein [Elusimicrobiota bacterium]
KQNILSRFVDIAVELFAMSVVLSYAAGLIEKDKTKIDALDLADLFCRQSKLRISRLFCDISRNQDKKSVSIAKKILAGKFEWLENDIIK